MNIPESLSAIREVIDKEVNDQAITIIQRKMLKCESLMGLAAECIKQSRQELLLKQMQVLSELPKGMGSNDKKLYINTACHEQDAQYTYADQIYSALKVSIDALRTTISLYKEELSKGMTGT